MIVSSSIKNIKYIYKFLEERHIRVRVEFTWIERQCNKIIIIFPVMSHKRTTLFLEHNLLNQDNVAM